MAFPRTLAEVGQAILCPIHRPSAGLFQSFNRVLLLRRGGETVYSVDLKRDAATRIEHLEGGGSRSRGPNSPGPGVDTHPDTKPGGALVCDPPAPWSSPRLIERSSSGVLLPFRAFGWELNISGVTIHVSGWCPVKKR